MTSTSTYINSIKIAKHQHHGRCPSANAYKESHHLGRVVERIGLLPTNDAFWKKFLSRLCCWSPLPLFCLLFFFFFSEALRLKWKFFSNGNDIHSVPRISDKVSATNMLQARSNPQKKQQIKLQRLRTAETLFIGPHHWRLTAGT